MQIEFHQGFRDVQRRSCTRLTLYDDHGNLLMVAVEMGSGAVQVFKQGDKGFEQALHFLGLAQTSIVEMIEPPRPLAIG